MNWPTLPRRSLLGLATLSALSAFTSFTRKVFASEWELTGDKDGIQVFRKTVPGTSLHAFRGTSLIDAPMGKVIWVLADHEHRTEWVDRLKKSVVLEAKSPYEFIVYQHFGSPPIVSDRDFVFHAKAESRKDGSAKLTINSATHKNAPPTAGVRGELRYSSYTLTPKGDKTFVDVEVLLDPKGALPDWVVNLVQKSWPRNTLLALRAQVKKSFVKTLDPPPLP